MAVARVSSVIAPGTGTTAIAIPSVNGGAGDALVVLASQRATSSSAIVSSITYGAQSLTELIAFNPFVSINAGAVTVAYLLAPVDTETVTITYASALNTENAAVYVLSGVDQATPFGTPATEYEPNGVNLRQLSVSSVADGLVVDGVALINDKINIATPLAPTEVGQTDPLTSQQSGSDSFGTSQKTGSALVTMGWEWGGDSGRSAYLLIPVNPAGGGTPGVRPPAVPFFPPAFFGGHVWR